MPDGPFNPNPLPDDERQATGKPAGSLDDALREPVEWLAEEFLQRRRAGEEISIERFAAEHPQQAAEILELFPAIAAIERVKQREVRRDERPADVGGPMPTRLGDFRLIREIGRGGMGVVYEAQQISLGRRVAVKVLPRQFLSTGKALDRFEREARTAAKLHHTNIVPVFGIGEQDGYHYIVMQLIVGVGIDEVLTELRRIADLELVAGPDDSSDRSSRAHQKAKDLLSHDFSAVKAPTPNPNSSDPVIDLNETDHASLPTSKGAWGSHLDPSANPRGPAAGPLADSPSHQLALDEKPHCPSEELASAHTRSTPAVADEDAPATPAQGARLGRCYWRNVTRIVWQAADALDYAHQQGILHRDIKPGNLLLDRNAALWVADFGLAKPGDQEAVSQTGDIVGTLNYIAPESLSGRTDRRSDIYSLGLTLYELVTLRSAYGGKTHARVLDDIRRSNIRPPSFFQPHVPRDLETIVLKAIAAEPEKRYATAGELAEDLHRFLEDRPIMARRASVIEHAWRWCRRNRGVAALSATLLASLALYAAVASYGYVSMARLRADAETQRQQADDQRKQADDQRKRAEQILELAIQALDKVYARFVPDQAVEYTDAIVDQESDGTSDEDESQDDPASYQIRPRPALSQETAAFLQEMLQFYDEFAQQDKANASWLFKAAAARRKVGDVQSLLGQHAEAEGSYRLALKTLTKLAPEIRSDGEVRQADIGLEQARANNGLGRTLAGLGLRRDAVRCHTEALQQLRSDSELLKRSPELRGEEARTLIYLSQPSPHDRPGRGGPGESPASGEFAERGGRRRREGRPPPPHDGAPDLPPPHENPGRFPFGLGTRGHFPFGPPPRGEDYLGQAIGSLEALTKEFPQVPEYRYLLARTLMSRSERAPRGDSETYDRALRTLEELVRDFPGAPDYRDELSRAYAGVRAIPIPRPDERRSKVDPERLKKASEMSQALLQEHPHIPRYHETAALIQQSRGRQLLHEKEWAEAESVLRSSASVLQELAARSPRDPHLRMLQKFSRMFLSRALAQQHATSPEKGEEALAIMQRVIQETKDEHARDPALREFARARMYVTIWHLENLRIIEKQEAADELQRQVQEFAPPPGPPRSPDAGEPPG